MKTFFDKKKSTIYIFCAVGGGGALAIFLYGCLCEEIREIFVALKKKFCKEKNHRFD